MWIFGPSSSGTRQKSRTGLDNTPPRSSETRLGSRTGWSMPSTTSALATSRDGYRSWTHPKLAKGLDQGWAALLLRAWQPPCILIRTLLRILDGMWSPCPRSWNRIHIITSITRSVVLGDVPPTMLKMI